MDKEVEEEEEEELSYFLMSSRMVSSSRLSLASSFRNSEIWRRWLENRKPETGNQLPENRKRKV